MHPRSFALLVLHPLLVCSVVLSQTDRGLIANRPIPVGGNPLASATGDLNHDGIQDVVIADGANATVSPIVNNGILVLLGQGGGTLGTPVRYATNTAPSFVCLADVDGDGNLDVVTASDNPPPPRGSSSMDVLKGRGDGTFGPPTSYQFGDFAASAVFPSDFNGDGHVDLAVEVMGNVPILVLMLNNGDGTFRVSQQVSGIAPGAVADFNLDGKPDLAVMTFHFGGIGVFSVWYGNGDGTFTPGTHSVSVSQILRTFILAVADFNHDGYPDLVFTMNSIGGSFLEVILNSPSGIFTGTPMGNATDDIPSGFAAADFNRDGNMDLAVVTQSNFLDILFGRGDGTFAPRVAYSISRGATISSAALNLADLNRDGVPDLVTTDP